MGVNDIGKRLRCRGKKIRASAAVSRALGGVESGRLLERASSRRKRKSIRKRGVYSD